MTYTGGKVFKDELSAKRNSAVRAARYLRALERSREV